MPDVKTIRKTVTHTRHSVKNPDGSKWELNEHGHLRLRTGRGYYPVSEVPLETPSALRAVIAVLQAKLHEMEGHDIARND